MRPVRPKEQDNLQEPSQRALSRLEMMDKILAQTQTPSPHQPKNHSDRWCA